MPQLSRIQKVDLREVWQHEAQNFTPWLADHISELGEALGLELESRSQEAPVGGYSLDILARDLGSDRPVIIENQLEGTDHDHLGKLLTYASGYDANIVVWIAREFRDEHRQALDWLNQRTDETTEFFGVVVELWKIDNSRPAVNFNLVSAPNEWRKESARSQRQPRTATTERSERYRAFFQSLIDTLRETHNFTRARIGQPQNWYSFSSGYSGIIYGANFPMGGARVELYIDAAGEDKNKDILKTLMNSKNSIEAILGPVQWDPLDGRRASRISVTRKGSIGNDQQTLEEIQDWMVDRLLKFKEAFDPHLRELPR